MVSRCEIGTLVGAFNKEKASWGSGHYETSRKFVDNSTVLCVPHRYHYFHVHDQHHSNEKLTLDTDHPLQFLQFEDFYVTMNSGTDL